LAAAGGSALAWIAAMESLAKRVSEMRWAAILLASSALAAASLLLSGSQRLAQIAALPAAAQAGMLVAGLWLGRGRTARGNGLVSGVLLGGLLMCGHLYSELMLAAALALFLAPPAAWLAQPLFARTGALVATAAQIGIVLVISGAAMWSAWRDFVAMSE
jgi:hypothetical protein